MITWASFPYDGTVVVVTGAGSGIGQAIARAFLENGASICVVGRHEPPLQETVQGFPEERVLMRTADVSDRTEVDDMISAVVDRFGRLDVVVNNAGVFEGGEIDDYDDAAWQRMHGINVDALLFVARAAMPWLQRSRGNIVAISSVSGMRGDWGQFAYNATKGAVNAMVQSLALDAGPHGVRANVIAPAFTATRLTRDRLDDPGFAAALADRVALGRAATPEDVARAVLFVAGPDAGYITGAVIPVDGGTTASTGQPRPV
ncbi:SDR family NAD(P)-dependent oxidoreductase [Kocuria nitroreducens]|uniref:SDR family NAD(P)-dependent oxidoreductase n=1 Tax=Kocuria nitroreducens TaxID=3058914 RepID=UPI0036DFA1AE